MFKKGDILKVTNFPVWGVCIEAGETHCIIDVDNPGKCTDPFLYKENDTTLIFDSDYFEKITKEERFLWNLKGL